MVERWRQQWREGRAARVTSKGSPGRPRLSDAQVARLERELRSGRAAPRRLAMAEQSSKTRPASRCCVPGLEAGSAGRRWYGAEAGARAGCPWWARPANRRTIAVDLRSPRIPRAQGPTEGFRLAGLSCPAGPRRIQLGGPVVLIWDNVRIHLTAALRETPVSAARSRTAGFRPRPAGGRRPAVSRSPFQGAARAGSAHAGRRSGS